MHIHSADSRYLLLAYLLWVLAGTTECTEHMRSQLRRQSCALDQEQCNVSPSDCIDTFCKDCANFDVAVSQCCSAPNYNAMVVCVGKALGGGITSSSGEIGPLTAVPSLPNTLLNGTYPTQSGSNSSGQGSRGGFLTHSASPSQTTSPDSSLGPSTTASQAGTASKYEVRVLVLVR